MKDQEDFEKEFADKIREIEASQRYEFRKGTKWFPWSWRNKPADLEGIKNTMIQFCDYLPDETSIEHILDEDDDKYSKQECIERIPEQLETLNFNRGDGAPCDYGLLIARVLGSTQAMGKIWGKLPLEKSLHQGRYIKDLRHKIGELLAQHITENCGCREEKDLEWRQQAAKSLRDLYYK